MNTILAIARAALWVFFILPAAFQCAQAGYWLAAVAVTLLLGALAHKATSLGD